LRYHLSLDYDDLYPQQSYIFFMQTKYVCIFFAEITNIAVK